MGRDEKSNSIIFYNPITSSYYRPPNLRLDKSRLPITNLPDPLCFYGGITCGLIKNKIDPIQEPSLQGTCVSVPRLAATVTSTNTQLAQVTGTVSSQDLVC